MTKAFPYFPSGKWRVSLVETVFEFTTTRGAMVTDGFDKQNLHLRCGMPNAISTQPAPSDTIAAVSTPFLARGRLWLSAYRGRVPSKSRHRFSAEPTAGRYPGARSAVFGRLNRMDVPSMRVVTVYHAPASYTGENLVEIACHGGISVTRAVLAAFLKAGARSAEPGEFTGTGIPQRQDGPHTGGSGDGPHPRADRPRVALRHGTAQGKTLRRPGGRAAGSNFIGITAHLECIHRFSRGRHLTPPQANWPATSTRWPRMPDGFSPRPTRTRAARGRAHGDLRRAECWEIQPS